VNKAPEALTHCILGYTIGRKLPNGTWTGLVGALATGDLDLIVADLTMTVERKEVVQLVTDVTSILSFTEPEVEAGINRHLILQFSNVSNFTYLQ
jgi:hypothetical protein